MRVAPFSFYAVSCLGSCDALRICFIVFRISCSSGKRTNPAAVQLMSTFTDFRACFFYELRTSMRRISSLTIVGVRYFISANPRSPAKADAYQAISAPFRIAAFLPPWPFPAAASARIHTPPPSLHSVHPTASRSHYRLKTVSLVRVAPCNLPETARPIPALALGGFLPLLDCGTVRTIALLLCLWYKERLADLALLSACRTHNLCV